MIKKIILRNEEAKAKLVSGINKSADIVEASIGPAGGGTIIGRMYQFPEIAYDGKKIADAILLDDETEQLAVDVIRESANNSDKIVGNGRKSTISILRGIINTCDKRLSSLVNPIHPRKLQKEISKAKEEVLAELKTQKTDVTTKEELAHIASVAMKDATYGDLLAETFWKIGKNGVLSIEDGFVTEVIYKDGLEIPCGSQASFMDGELSTHIIVTNHELNSALEIVPLIKKLVDNKIFSVAIFAQGFSRDVIGKLFELKFQGMNVLTIKLPGGKRDYLEDISALTGVTIVESDTTKLADLEISHLGVCSKFILNKDSSTIIGGAGNTTVHLEKLKDEIQKAGSLYDKEQLEKRVAKLENGVAVLKVFAPTDLEKEGLKSRFKDAIVSTRNALREGYVKGGGLALKEIADKLPESILTDALRAPYEKIQANAGESIEITEDVIDAYLVVEQSVNNACSLASEFINVLNTIAEKVEEPKNQN